MKKTIVTTPEEATQILTSYDFKQTSFDVETTGRRYEDRWVHGGGYGRTQQPTGISFCNGQQAIYIDTCEWTREDLEPVLEVLRKRWAVNKAKDKTIIAHNIPFDMGALYKYGIKLWGAEWFCTMTAAHLIGETDKKSLKKQAQKLLGETETKSWEEAKTDRKTFHEYALNDAIWSWELAQRQSRILRAEGLETLFRTIEMPYQVILMQMEVCGIPVDKEKITRIRGELETALDEATKDLLEYLGEHYHYGKECTVRCRIECKKHRRKLLSPINFNSHQQIADILFDRLGLEVVEYTANDNPSTGRATLEHYSNHPFVKLLRKYKVINKLLTAFFKPLPQYIDKDGRVRPNFKNTGTVTGRLSCAEPNMQQQPKKNDLFPVETRSCFIAPEGYKMLTADYSGQEVCVLAHVSQDEKLIRALENGYDLHLAIARDFLDLDIPEEALSKTHPEYQKYKDKYSKERGRAKTITFGLSYGKSAYGFAKDFDITEDEGQQILDDYFERFPGVKKAIDECKETVDKQGEVTQHYGRKRRFSKNRWGGYDDRAYRQAFNFLIQSPSADMIRQASINVLHEQIRNPEWGLRQVATVHDENVYLVKEEYLEPASEAVEKAFLKATNSFSVPFGVDLGVGDDYAQAK